MSKVSAVLFVRDHVKVAAFYRDALGFARTAGDADHTALDCLGFELTIHQIPRRFLDESPSSGAPERRERSAIRLNFPMLDIAAARPRAASLGGKIDDAPPPWAARDANFFLGHDPEGNVFALTG